MSSKMFGIFPILSGACYLRITDYDQILYEGPSAGLPEALEKALRNCNCVLLEPGVALGRDRDFKKSHLPNTNVTLTGALNVYVEKPDDGSKSDGNQ